ncbi:hypothetical protein CWATWH0003_5552 [Crocosphaera watsonii WH 0003]|uniref:Uncharacterized protein n=2 Tax=Crocosphaera watsonii TaxID=263511 RepID=G5JDR1_CROWT|nr:hypothetical protein CWATWH0003_5552 [Crocosphaera watsonii WH 0003]CCQ55682.1 hypothetical protein CWATWH0005_3774 [Crocosphaera watsonii WH 0005]
MLGQRLIDNLSSGDRHICPHLEQVQLADCLTLKAISSQLSGYLSLFFIDDLLIIRNLFYHPNSQESIN